MASDEPRRSLRRKSLQALGVLDLYGDLVLEALQRGFVSGVESFARFFQEQRESKTREMDVLVVALTLVSLGLSLMGAVGSAAVSAVAALLSIAPMGDDDFKSGETFGDLLGSTERNVGSGKNLNGKTPMEKTVRLLFNPEDLFTHDQAASRKVMRFSTLDRYFLTKPNNRQTGGAKDGQTGTTDSGTTIEDLREELWLMLTDARLRFRYWIETVRAQVIVDAYNGHELNEVIESCEKAFSAANEFSAKRGPTDAFVWSSRHILHAIQAEAERVAELILWANRYLEVWKQSVAHDMSVRHVKYGRKDVIYLDEEYYKPLASIPPGVRQYLVERFIRNGQEGQPHGPQIWADPDGVREGRSSKQSEPSFGPWRNPVISDPLRLDAERRLHTLMKAVIQRIEPDPKENA